MSCATKALPEERKIRRSNNSKRDIFIRPGIRLCSHFFRPQKNSPSCEGLFFCAWINLPMSGRTAAEPKPVFCSRIPCWNRPQCHFFRPRARRRIADRPRQSVCSSRRFCSPDSGRKRKKFRVGFVFGQFHLARTRGISSRWRIYFRRHS